MPRLTTLNSLYKFIPAKLCHPMRICVERSYWSVNDWYGTYRATHAYHIVITDSRMFIRYENSYWHEEVINKYA